MNATEWQNRYFWPRLQLRQDLPGWDEHASHLLKLWEDTRLAIDVTSVCERRTRNFGYHDFDVTGLARARSEQLRLNSGCDGDIVVDATFGVHYTNRHEIRSDLWYSSRVGRMTLRCHEGHPMHSMSWRIPGAPTWRRINRRLIVAYGSAICGADDSLELTFRSLMQQIIFSH